MIRHLQLEPRFVKGVPRELEPGVLYVSMEYGTVVHSCCCGCGHEVVTPLTPTDWRLSFDGEGVSLWPSVGNWNLPCQSHYVIEDNRVWEAGPWSRARIQGEQARDRQARAKFYAKADTSLTSEPLGETQAPDAPQAPVRLGFAARLARWFSK
jgi:hypothetical protein